MRIPLLGRTAPIMLTALVALAGADSARAEPRVDLELAFEPGFPLDGSQKWMEALERSGASNVRIRQGRVGDRTELATTGAGSTAVHRATGILTADNRLQLPAGTFSLQDSARIGAWIAKVKAGGLEELTAPRTSFGLTEREFAEFRERLAAPLTLSTKDQTAATCAKTVAGSLGYPISADAAARSALNGEWRLPDELQGLSQGTSLALLLRPLGLAFAPQRELGGKIDLKIAAPKDLAESWPIGWPLRGTVQQTAPDLFKFLNVEIDDTPLPEAVDAIRGRLEMPFAYDYNHLVRDRVDMDAVKVSAPSGRTYYKRLLDRLYIQAKLKSDVRLDEAGKPFLWITTTKP